MLNLFAGITVILGLFAFFADPTVDPDVRAVATLVFTLTSTMVYTVQVVIHDGYDKVLKLDNHELTTYTFVSVVSFMATLIAVNESMFKDTVAMYLFPIIVVAVYIWVLYRNSRSARYGVVTTIVQYGFLYSLMLPPFSDKTTDNLLMLVILLTLPLTAMWLHRNAEDAFNTNQLARRAYTSMYAVMLVVLAIVIWQYYGVVAGVITGVLVAIGIDVVLRKGWKRL